MRTAVNFERAAASREISENFERLLLVTTCRLCLERGVAFLGRSMNDSRLTVLWQQTGYCVQTVECFVIVLDKLGRMWR